MRYLLLLLPAALFAAQAPSTSRKAPVVKAAATTTTVVRNFKESGSPSAPVTVEIYADYECPACRALFMEVVPPLMTDFVQTGKVRLIHRDFPLPMHQYSKLAARYANAAGEIGKYDLVANQIFQTQPEWAANGNVDSVVARVLSPADMQRVRDLVKNDPRLDETVARDVAMGNQDHLTQTPTIIITAKGKREKIDGGMPYQILKSYLNAKLAG
jgi:protein-disulfide isomerase